MGTTRATVHNLATFAVMLTKHNLTMSSEDEYIRIDGTEERVGRIIRYNNNGIPMTEWVIEMVTSLENIWEVYMPGVDFLADMVSSKAATLHMPRVKNHISLNLAGQALKHCQN